MFHRGRARWALILLLIFLQTPSTSYSSAILEALADDFEQSFDEKNSFDPSEALAWGFQAHRFVDMEFALEARRIRLEIKGEAGRPALLGQIRELQKAQRTFPDRVVRRLRKIRSRVEKLRNHYDQHYANAKADQLAERGAYLILQESVMRPISELAALLSESDALEAYRLHVSLFPEKFLSETLRAPAENDKTEGEVSFSAGVLVRPGLEIYSDRISKATTEIEKYEAIVDELEKNPAYLGKSWYGSLFGWLANRFNPARAHRIYWDVGMSEEEKKATLARRDELIEMLKGYDETEMEKLRQQEMRRREAATLAREASYHTRRNNVGTVTSPFKALPETIALLDSTDPKTRKEKMEAASEVRKNNYIEALRLMTIANMLNQIDLNKKVARDAGAIPVPASCSKRFSQYLDPKVFVNMISDSQRQENLTSMMLGNGLVVGQPEFKDFFISHLNPNPVSGSFTGTLPFYFLRIAQQGLAHSRGDDPILDPRNFLPSSPQITFHSLGEPGFDDLISFEAVYKQLAGKALSDRFRDPNNQYKEKYADAIFNKEDYTWTENVLDPDTGEMRTDTNTIRVTPFLAARMRTAGSHDWEAAVPAAVKSRLERERIQIAFPPFYGPEAYKQWALRLIYSALSELDESRLRAAGADAFVIGACRSLLTLQANRGQSELCANLETKSYGGQSPIAPSRPNYVMPTAPVVRVTDLSRFIDAWKTRLEKFSVREAITPPSYIYDDDMALVWGNFRTFFHGLTTTGAFNHIDSVKLGIEAGPWTNEWEFLKHQVGLNPWAAMRLSFVIAMEEQKVFFDDPDLRPIERFKKKHGLANLTSLTPEQEAEYKSIKINTIRRVFPFTSETRTSSGISGIAPSMPYMQTPTTVVSVIDHEFKSQLRKAAEIFGVDNPLLPMHGNRVLNKKQKKMAWEDLLHEENLKSDWLLLTKNDSMRDYSIVLDTVEKQAILTRRQVENLRGQLASAGVRMDGLQQWLSEAEKKFPKYANGTDGVQRSPNSIEEWQESIDTAKERLSGATDQRLHEEILQNLRFEIWLDIWRNPLKQQDLLQLYYDNFPDSEDPLIEMKAAFFERDKAFKMAFFEQVLTSAARARNRELLLAMDELCELDANTLDGFKNIFYSSTRFHDAFNDHLGLGAATPPEVIKAVNRMSDRDKKDLWTAAAAVGFLLAFEVSKVTCVSIAAPVACPLAAGLATGAGFAFTTGMLVLSRFNEWQDRELRMRVAQQFRELEFNRDSDVREFRGGGAGGFAVELLFAAPALGPILTTGRLVIKSGSAAAKVAAARIAGRKLTGQQIRNIFEEIEVDEALRLAGLSRGKSVQEVVKETLRGASGIKDLMSRSREGLGAWLRNFGTATEVLESAKTVDLAIAKKIYVNFNGRGTELSRFIRGEFRLDAKKYIEAELAEYLAKPNPAKLKRLAELDPKLYSEIIKPGSPLAQLSAKELNDRFLGNFENLLRGLENMRGDELVKLLANEMDTLAPFLSKFSFRHSGFFQKGAKFGGGFLFIFTMQGTPWMFTKWPGLKQVARRAYMKQLMAARNKLQYHIEMRPHLLTMGYGDEVVDAVSGEARRRVPVVKIDVLDLFGRVRKVTRESVMRAGLSNSSKEVREAAMKGINQAIDNFEMNFAQLFLAHQKKVPVGQLNPAEILQVRNQIFAAKTLEQRNAARALLKGVELDELFHPEKTKEGSLALVRLLNREFGDLLREYNEMVLKPLIAAHSARDVRKLDIAGRLSQLVKKQAELLTIHSRMDDVILY